MPVSPVKLKLSKEHWALPGIFLTPKQGHLKWDIILGLVILHLGALLAPWTFTWKGFWTLVVLQFITAVGITLGYHRYLTHRNFRCPKWVEYAITLAGLHALQGGPIKWVSTHRIHHAFSDRPSDPHSPNRGFWWAHIGWLCIYDKLIDDPKSYEKFVPDLLQDPVHRFLEKTVVLHAIVLGALLLLWGGLSALIWGLFLRTVIVYHTTWLVNSAAHVWGYQTYTTNEGSRNNWWVALLTFGEGWHNNHHAYPHSAAHGLRWWELDVTYLTIRLMKALRLVRRVQLPKGGPARLPLPQAPSMPVASMASSVASQ